MNAGIFVYWLPFYGLHKCNKNSKISNTKSYFNQWFDGLGFMLREQRPRPNESNIKSNNSIRKFGDGIQIQYSPVLGVGEYLVFETSIRSGP